MPEVYREKFRSIKKDNTITFTEFAFRLETSFKRWIRSLNVIKFEELKQVVLIEQYMTCLPDDIRIWLLDRNQMQLNSVTSTRLYTKTMLVYCRRPRSLQLLVILIKIDFTKLIDAIKVTVEVVDSGLIQLVMLIVQTMPEQNLLFVKTM